MKHLRIWLLLLLAVLLPVRGAMAAAMLCPPAGVGTQNEVQLLDHHAGHHAGHHAMMEEGHHAGHDHAMHDHGASGLDEDADSPSAQDKCNLCSAFCSATPLVSAAPVLPVPQALSATVFPDLAAPAPSFLSDGQERPPRSI